MHPFKEKIRNEIISCLKNDYQALSCWECGSASNQTSDIYSDLDLRVIGQEDINELFFKIENRLNLVSKITHRYIEPKSVWANCYSRIYFLEKAPKHFFIDLGIILNTAADTITELLQIERHGSPIIHFDKIDLIKPLNVNLLEFNRKIEKRLVEIESAFQIYSTEVEKEIDRGHFIDAYAFFFSGLIRPLVELMGMIYRPFKFDFGLRYLYSTFPESEQKKIESLLKVNNIDELKVKSQEAQLYFKKFQTLVRKNEK